MNWHGSPSAVVSLNWTEGTALANQSFTALTSETAIDERIGGTGETGEIHIRTERAEQGVLVSIQDTGHGIPSEDLPRIFDPFFTTKEVGKGTGLGLSLSHGIIERHGGRIRVASRPGEGAAFEIDLPLQAPSVAEGGEEIAPSGEARAV